MKVIISVTLILTTLAIILFSAIQPISSVGLDFAKRAITQLSVFETRWYYFIILCSTLIWPVIASFVPVMQFRSEWKYTFLPFIIWMGIFMVWDHFFTLSGVWGFNESYILDIKLGGLPLEEILFFFVIPVACLLLYKSVKLFLPVQKWSFLSVLHLIYIVGISIVGIVYIENIYTGISAAVAVLGYLLLFLLANSHLRTFFLTYLITLLPMTFVNSALTGSFTLEPVVIYNPNEIIGLRYVTMPVEDLIYNYGMLAGFILIYEIQKKLSSS